MYNYIDNVKDKLQCNNGIGTLPRASYMLNALENMKIVLKKYYSTTALIPTVDGDGMILNPRCKLVLLHDESWDERDAEQYALACRQRFISMYENKAKVPGDPSINDTKICSSSAFSNDLEYQPALISRSAKCRRNDFSSYIEIPNNPDLPSRLG
jgi:hypothetical protein